MTKSAFKPLKYAHANFCKNLRKLVPFIHTGTGIAFAAIALSGCGGGGNSTSAGTANSSGTVSSTPLQLLQNTDTQSIEIRSSTSSLTATGAVAQEQTLRVRSTGFNSSAWSNSKDGNFVLIDETHGYTIAVQRTPDFTATRVYDGNRQWIAGGLSYNDGTSLRASPMANESDTTTIGRSAASTVLSIQASSGIKTVAASTAATQGECERFINGIVSSPSEYASNASNVLEKVEELADGVNAPKPPGIVGRAAQFLSDVWSAAPSLCDDAAQPVSEKEYYRGVVAGAFDAIFDTQLKKIIETATSLDDLRSKVEILARDAITRLGNTGSTRYQSTEAPSTTGLSNTTTAQAVGSLDINKTSVPALTNCISGMAVPVVTYNNSGAVQSFRYREDWTNQCGVDINVLYCSIILPGQCIPNNFKTLARGVSFSVLGRETVNDQNLVTEATQFIICPDTVNGQTVYLDGRGNPACYTYKK